MPKQPLLQHVDLPLPNLPPALEGLRLAHISDLHAHRDGPRWRRLADLLANIECDLALFTGDYMTFSHHEVAADGILRDVASAISPRLGRFGIFGNHDTPELKHRLQDAPVTWLNNAAIRMPDLPLDLLGVDTTEHRDSDPFGALMHLVSHEVTATNEPRASASGCPVDSKTHNPNRFRLLLSHIPNLLPIAADLGVDLMLSGHTHGGQMRLPIIGPLYNSTDLPLAFTSGILRYGRTTACTSRGLGEVHLTFRLHCPRQLPVYTLKQGNLPGEDVKQIQCVQSW